MIKLIALLRKKPGLTAEAFKDYYENHHAPLVMRLAPIGHGYRRNYPVLARKEGKEVDLADAYDVIAEMSFADKADYEAFSRAMRDPEVSAQIIADENRFLDRAAGTILTVESYESAYA